MANGRPWAAYNESPLTGRVKGGFILANYTEHYGLHQWVPEDDFLRTDFNTDFALIDAALAGLAAADGAESQTRSQEDGALSAAITAGDNAQASALASAKTALQNAITAGDNAQASALAAAKTSLQQTINRKLEFVTGSFVGTAVDNSVTEQHIALGFQPCFVVFGNASFWYGGQGGPDNNCVVIYPGVPCDGISGGSRNGGAQIEATGFLVYGVSNYINTTYQYIAFRTV